MNTKLLHTAGGLAATLALLAAGPAGAASLSDDPARDTITGTPGNDDLVGTHGPDIIRALAGDAPIGGHLPVSIPGLFVAGFGLSR